MSLFNFLKKQEDTLKKISIESENNIGLLFTHLYYVEGEHNKVVNDFISKYYNDITKEISRCNESGKLAYIPNSTDDLFDNENDLQFLLKYYYPGLKIEDDYKEKIYKAMDTAVFTNSVFSLLGYNEDVSPGFLRLAEITPDGKEYRYTYEYIQLDLNNIENLETQVKNCISQCFADKPDHSASDAVYNNPMSGSISETLADGFEEEENDFKIILEDYTFHHDVFEEKEDKQKSLEELFNVDQPDDIPPSHADIFQHHAKRIDGKVTPKRKKPEDVSKLKMLSVNLSKKEAYLVIKSDTNTIKNIRDSIIKKVGHSLLKDEDGIVTPQLSKIVIDNEHNIFLTDFNNRQVKLNALSKALYFLFLRHPEGIILKEMADYKDELKKIYLQLTKKEHNFEGFVSEHIDRLCDPGDKSKDEKLSVIKRMFSDIFDKTVEEKIEEICNINDDTEDDIFARIRNAFVRIISEDVAESYFITGKKVFEKKIRIPQSLVQFPKSINDIKITDIHIKYKAIRKRILLKRKKQPATTSALLFNTRTEGTQQFGIPPQISASLKLHRIN